MYRVKANTPGGGGSFGERKRQAYRSRQCVRRGRWGADWSDRRQANRKHERVRKRRRQLVPSGLESVQRNPVLFLQPIQLVLELLASLWAEPSECKRIAHKLFGQGCHKREGMRWRCYFSWKSYSAARFEEAPHVVQAGKMKKRKTRKCTLRMKTLFRVRIFTTSIFISVHHSIPQKDEIDHAYSIKGNILFGAPS